MCSISIIFSPHNNILSSVVRISRGKDVVSYTVMQCDLTMLHMYSCDRKHFD